MDTIQYEGSWNISLLDLRPAFQLENRVIELHLVCIKVYDRDTIIRWNMYWKNHVYFVLANKKLEVTLNREHDKWLEHNFKYQIFVCTTQNSTLPT